MFAAAVTLMFYHNTFAHIRKDKWHYGWGSKGWDNCSAP